ncbi:glycosyltransferase involved in cell wall biosynthesis [Variovorax beijingensis]|uniref:Glycosyltransferase involved in cell wall biosynthesis n=1 Tax=Variovorax beijingensis TaxID=2496117 RepID=A0A561C7F3_9BURK|nr:glycosyltransferase [Variovorax beijingensis]TWD87141.1 glycosyltransferase involved in cell wall biosynthesis [Variovorax beijingensis]
MRIVIDLQGALSLGNRKRGIGRYTSSLAQAIARRARNHEIVLALNGRFPDAIDEIQSTFDGIIEPRNFRVWHPPLYSDRASPGSRRAREKLYEAFLASLQPDVVHVSSLFEGLDDAAVTSIGSFVRQPTAVTLYDLIPLINARPYLEQDRIRSWYMRKVESLRRADMWLAISESSRQEGIDHLGLAGDRCINISTAAYDHFKMARPTAQREQELRDRYGLNQPFVMYTGGIDVRKNLEGLVRAFGLLPPEIVARHQLAIVCSARPEDRKALLELAEKSGLEGGKLVVTGFVPEQDLVDLYNLCSLFVFPSWHEGFGLPALEAMHCGAVVIAANTSSLPEVIGRRDALFEPRNDLAMATKMAQGLTDEGFRSALREHGLTQARKFSWDESARRAIEGFEALHRSSNRAPSGPPALQHPRPRLAFLSPLPPQPSGIADYSAELLPALAQHYEIDLVAALGTTTDAYLTTSFPVRSLEWFRRHSALFDRVLYHFGNSEFHEHMFLLLEEIPGVVVLHDFYLSGAQAFREFGAGQPHAWVRALYSSHGYPAVIKRFRTNDVKDTIYKYPCSLDILRYAQGVIVHSPHAIDLARNWYGSIAENMEMVPLLRAPAPRDPGERQRAREDLGLKPDDFLVCSFGLLGPAKLAHRVLQAWQASSLAKDPRCKLRFVGENPSDEYGAELLRQIAQGGRDEDVEITGWASSETYRRYLAAADLAVQLRAQSRGETSAAVLDTMSRGIPTIVNAHGSMAFLPRDAVFMLEDDFDDAQLIEALESQWHDLAGRLALGAKGQAIVETLHAPTTCAKLYAEVIERFMQRASTGRTALIRAIGEADPLVQSTDGHHEALELASAIAETLPLPMSRRQLFIDVSGLAENGTQTRQTLDCLIRGSLDVDLEGYRVEPVCASESGKPDYCYARRYALALRKLPADALADEPIDFRAGDFFAVLIASPDSTVEHAEFYRKLRQSGVRVRFFQIATNPGGRVGQHSLDVEVHPLYLSPTTTPDDRPDEQAAKAFLKSLIDVDALFRSSRN